MKRTICDGSPFRYSGVQTTMSVASSTILTKDGRSFRVMPKATDVHSRFSCSIIFSDSLDVSHGRACPVHTLETSQSWLPLPTVTVSMLGSSMTASVLTGTSTCTQAASPMILHSTFATP